MTDKGRIVPPHASGGGQSFVKHPRVPFAYPGRNPHRNDPDETEGRALYRGLANAEARRQLAYERHKARLKTDGKP